MEHPSIRATVDVDTPQRGIHQIFTQSNPWTNSQLLSIDMNRSARDAYVRHDDLIATYEQTEAAAFRTQLDWRVFVGEQIGFELFLSAQTSLLNSDPSIQMKTTTPVESIHIFMESVLEEISHGDYVSVETPDAVQATLVRPAGIDWSYIELLNDSDFHQIEIDWPADRVAQITYHLFPEELEKGVIRRARARGIFVPRDGDEQAVGQCVKALSNAPPPLTT